MGLVVSATASCSGNLLGRRSPPPSPTPSTTADSSPPPTKVSESDQDLERVFRHFDADGDGRISAAEMRKFPGRTDEEAEQMVAAADTDGDGFISFEELRAVMEGGDDSDTLRAAFDHYDENNDGVITAEELRRVLRRLGLDEEELTAEQCEGMVAAFDSDGDGVVSFDEFKAMMTATPPPA